MTGLEVTYKAIGVIHSEFTETGSTPIQSAFSEAIGTVEVFPEYAAGLKDIEGFSHLILIYHLDKSRGFTLLRKPFLDGSEERGIFAIRHFARPNPIGLSIVELTGVRGNILDIKGVDVFDGTPLLDIKPYVKRIDVRENVRSGWFDEQEEKLKDKKTITPDSLKK